MKGFATPDKKQRPGRAGAPQRPGRRSPWPPAEVIPVFRCACGGACPRCRDEEHAPPPLQPKLEISQPGDPWEREADRVAEQVVRMPADDLPGAPLPVRRRTPPGSASRKEAPGDALRERSASVTGHPVANLGRGAPLPHRERGFFEPRFGHDFQEVRIHTGGRAADAARALSARAFTVGRDIVFGAGEYAPGDGRGRRILAHELTHVVQQRHTGPRIQRLSAEVNASGGCVATTVNRGTRTSTESFEVAYDNDKGNAGELTLIDNTSGKAIYSHPREIPAKGKGKATIPKDIEVPDDGKRYRVQIVVKNSRGVPYANLSSTSKNAVRFQLCTLPPKPAGESLLVAKALYAEGVDAGEFPYVRDLLYNRKDWATTTCPGDARDFCNKDDCSLTGVLNAPNQFESVLSETAKFKQLEEELDDKSGKCGYTTPPTGGNVKTCKLVTAAVQTTRAGDGNTHDYVFFRSDTSRPSERAVDRWRYTHGEIKGNYYWKIEGCPKERRPKKKEEKE